MGMTIREMVVSPERQVLMVVFFLLLTLQMTLVIAAFRDGRRRGVRCFWVLSFSVSFFLLYLLILEIFREPLIVSDGAEALPAYLLYFRSLPVFVLILFEGIMALILATGIRDLVHYRRNHPTSRSIKETMDLLPVGIAFGKNDGMIVLQNLVMQHLARALTGKGIISPSVFREKGPGAIKTEEEEHSVQVELPDGPDVWQLASETVSVDGESFLQMTAVNITEEAAIAKELEEKNRKLRELHMRLDIYHQQAGRIIIAQELLTARRAVHSELGNVLLESRHYLKEPASIDEEKLLQALKNTNRYLLREYEEDDTGRDPLTEALEMAEAIGVDVVITGIIPQEDPDRMILAAAVSECATNTVKHADGDRLSVQVQCGSTETIVVLKNNGIQPETEIRESGGLCSLRSLVEDHHGTMRITISPEYRLEIRLLPPPVPLSFTVDSEELTV